MACAGNTAYSSGLGWWKSGLEWVRAQAAGYTHIHQDSGSCCFHRQCRDEYADGDADTNCDSYAYHYAYADEESADQSTDWSAGGRCKRLAETPDPGAYWQ